MRLLRLAALAAVASCAYAATHIVDTLLMNDGATPMTGRIYAVGPTGHPTQAATTQTITIGAGGAVDFTLLGCNGCTYRATYQVTNSRGVVYLSFSETWAVPDTVSVLTRAKILDGSGSPYGLINPQRVSGAGLAAGQLWLWNGTAYEAAYPSSSSNAGVADPGSNGVMVRTALNTSGVVSGTPTDCVKVNGTSGPCGTGGSGTPGGSSGQVQVNNSGAFGGITIGGDASLNPLTGALTVTKTSGSLFGDAATKNVGTTAGTVAAGNDTRITGAQQTSEKGAINGYASLDSSGKVPAAQLPSSSGMTAVIQDTAPQLGGNLDMNGFTLQTVTPTEMAYVHGVTSGIQGQLDAKTALSLLTTLGDLPYRGSGGWSRLPGNTSTTRQFLCQTGTGTGSAIPAWCGILAADVPSLAESQITGLVSDLAAKAPLAAPSFTAPSAAYDASALSSELLSGSGWTSTGWTGNWASGWTHTAGNTNSLSYPVSITAGHSYLVVFTISGASAGAVSVSMGGVSGVNYGNAGANSFGANVTYYFGPTVTSTAALTFTPVFGGAFNGTLQSISVKEITAVSTPLLSIKDSSGSVSAEWRTSPTSLTNLLIGINAGANATLGAVNNTFLGAGAGFKISTGQNNVAVGHTALYNVSLGWGNTAAGEAAGTKITNGYLNSCFGLDTCGFAASAMTGSTNAAHGAYAGNGLTTGSSNTLVGPFAGHQLTTGSDTVALGNTAGSYLADGTTPNTDSASSVYIGGLSKAKQAGVTNEVVIGNSAIGNGSNTATLGNDSITDTYLKGIVHAVSPAFTGTPTAPTASQGTNNTQIATTAYVDTLGATKDPVTTVTTLPTAATATIGRIYRWTQATAANTCPALGAGGSGGSTYAYCATIDGAYWYAVILAATDGSVTLPAGVTAAGFTTSGSAAGFDALGQGTAPTFGSGAGQIPTTGYTGWAAPASGITASYLPQLPPTAPSGSNTFLSCPAPTSNLSQCTWTTGGSSSVSYAYHAYTGTSAVDFATYNSVLVTASGANPTVTVSAAPASSGAPVFIGLCNDGTARTWTLPSTFKRVLPPMIASTCTYTPANYDGTNYNGLGSDETPSIIRYTAERADPGAGGCPSGGCDFVDSTAHNKRFRNASDVVFAPVKVGADITVDTGIVAKVNGNTPGGTCSGQFVRVIDSSGRPTCQSIATSDVPPVNFPAPGTSVTLTGPSEYYECSGTCTVTLPVPAAGYQFCVANAAGSTAAITLAAIGSSAMYEKPDHSTYGTAGTGTFVSTAGTFASVCVVGRDSTHYRIWGTPVGTWTAN